MVPDDKFYVWNFDVDELEKIVKDNELLLNIPKHFHVRKVYVKTREGHNFLYCGFGFYDHIGVQYHYVFHVTNCMSLEIFHVRFWKIFNTYYSQGCDIYR